MNPFTDAKVHEGLTQAEYFALPYLSRSDLVAIRKDHVRWKHGAPVEETEAMRIGTLIHGLVLEGQEWQDSHVVIVPAASICDSKGNVAKSPKATKAWGEIVAANAGMTVLLDYEFTPYAAIRDAAKAAFAGMLEQSAHEVVVTATHKRTGVTVKARLDMASPKFVADFKTARSASPQDFALTVFYGYLDMQAAIYSDVYAAVCGVESLPFWFAAQEKEGNLLSGIYDLSPAWIESGRNRYEDALDTFVQFEEQGWPGPIYRGTLEPKRWEVD